MTARRGLPECIIRRGDAYQVKIKHDGAVYRRDFRTLKEAKADRDRYRAERRTRRPREAGATITFAEAAEALIAGMLSGDIRTPRREPYKRKTIRTYRSALDAHVLPAIGRRRLADIDRAELVALSEQLISRGLSRKTVSNAFDPVHKVFKRAYRDGLIPDNPATDLELTPAPKNRIWADDPARVARAIDALPDHPRCARALWTTAFHAGLRWGELQALRWADVDFAGGALDVRRSWDREVGEIAPKSAAGRRRVPMTAPVREALLALHTADIRHDILVFGDGPNSPVAPHLLYDQTRKAWDAAGLTAEWLAAGLEVPTLHCARHHCISMWGRSGAWELKRLMEAAGHADVRQTMRYTHVIPGREAAAAEAMDRALESL